MPSPGHKDKTASLRDIAAAPAILLIGGDPTEEHPLLAWELRTNVRLNKARLYIANSEDHQAGTAGAVRCRDSPERLQGSDHDSGPEHFGFCKAVMAEESLVNLFWQGVSRGTRSGGTGDMGIGAGERTLRVSRRSSNSRGAADMGLFPDLLPGYVPVSEPGAFAEYAGLPGSAGKTYGEILSAAASGDLGALLAVGSNPAAAPGFDAANLKKTFVIVQDIFLTETAAIADVVFPAASLYEKSGTVTNTYGDVQFVKKAADHSGVKPDFEILVRLGGSMGVDVKSLVPFGKSGVTADLGQSRGAQSGEADRHAVWLASNGLEPKLSPFDPLAALDEIQRLVPGYALDRVNLLGGNDVRTEPGFVPVSTLARARAEPSLLRMALYLRRRRWDGIAQRSRSCKSTRRMSWRESAAD